MIRILVHRLTARSLTLVALRDGADRRGGRARGVRPRSGDERVAILVDDNGLCEGAADRRRLASSACTTPTSTTCASSPTGASCSSALLQALGVDVVHPGGALLLVPDADHRPRRVPASPRCCVIALVVGWRLAFEWLSAPGRPARAAAARRHQRRPPSRWRASCYERRHELGVEIVGFVDPDPARVGSAGAQPRRHRHDRRHSGDRPRRSGVDRVVVSLADARGKLPMDKLLEMKLERRHASITWRRSTRSTPARSRSRTCVRAG